MLDSGINPSEQVARRSLVGRMHPVILLEVFTTQISYKIRPVWIRPPSSQVRIESLLPKEVESLEPDLNCRSLIRVDLKLIVSKYFGTQNGSAKDQHSA